VGLFGGGFFWLLVFLLEFFGFWGLGGGGLGWGCGLGWGGVGVFVDFETFYGFWWVSTDTSAR